MSYEIFRRGLDAPICLTWEITYGCNLRCVHCLSSSGKRRSDELTTDEAKRLIDEWAEMKVFYINVGGGEPMSRRDFFELMDYTLGRGIGVKFSTNGTLIDDAAAAWIASRDYLDVQISLDGARPETNDPIRGEGSYDRARRAMELLSKHGFRFKINATVTRHNYPEIDDLYAIANHYGAELRLTRLRPTGRGRDVWDGLRPTHAQNRGLYEWLLGHRDVLTGEFVLPPVGLWSADGRTEHVRRRPHRLLRRPCRRGVRLSVHAGAGVLRRQRASGRRIRRRVAELAVVRAPAGLAGRRRLPDVQCL